MDGFAVLGAIVAIGFIIKHLSGSSASSNAAGTESSRPTYRATSTRGRKEVEDPFADGDAGGWMYEDGRRQRR